MKAKSFASWLMSAFMFASCNVTTQPELPIVILFDNDVHCGIEGYVQFAGLRDAIAASDTAYCAAVSSGDFIQGGMAGTLSKGQYVIDVINSVGYDAMTLGNHEFDYGSERLFELLDQLVGTTITCVNFTPIGETKSVYAPYVIKQMGPKKVAFVGVLTPSTLLSESAAFYDADGKQIYDLHTDATYQMVQQAVDDARHHGADYVVVLSHLGENRTNITSQGLIAATTGIDVVLDGHSHSVIPCDTVPNLKGQPVLVTQTGTKMANVGKLVISTDGGISTELISSDSIPYRNERVATVVDSINTINAEFTNRVCGENTQLLTINGPDGKRMVRRGETNLANFITDGMRWIGKSEIALVNGGGIRADLPMGEISYGKLLDVQPFDNELCVARISGSQIWSAIEISCSDLPAENGMIIQTSGLRYEVNLNEDPRVTTVEVLNAQGKYVPIDLDHEYTVTLSTYMLSQYEGVLRNCEIISPSLCSDVESTYNYVTSALKGKVGPEYEQPQGRLKISQ